jgi:hypothetical protein
MKLTKELIELQGFSYNRTRERCHAFVIINGTTLYTLCWFKDDSNICLEKHFYADGAFEEEVENMYDGPMPNLIQFLRMLIHYKELTDGKITLPNDIVDMFMLDDYDDYTNAEFDDMCEMILLSLLAKEDYEKCQEFLDYRKSYYAKNNWEYKDMPEDSFKDYSKITEKSF